MDLASLKHSLKQFEFIRRIQWLTLGTNLVLGAQLRPKVEIFSV
jgi:hypothetical protein